MGFNLDIHHRQSIRLPTWDYSSSGAYFVTVCSYRKECIFGEVKNGKMEPTWVGHIVAEEWMRTGCLREYVDIDEYVVMPNHFHGIVWIGERRGMARHAPTYGQFARPTPRSLPTIVGAFKSAVTKRVGAIDPLFGPIWQRNYYERIIRDDAELHRVREYIVNNPRGWELDQEYPRNYPS